MLTFTRKNGQSVVIQVAGHPPLTITFLGSRPGKCQLAFDGPQDYHILREEITFRERVDTGLRCTTHPEKAESTPRRETVCAT
ncbi:MAG: carbon storage regulator [Planctomycetes bacterium]|nr:carbon storage regulator [Planctomycetota bacterium]